MRLEGRLFWLASLLLTANLLGTPPNVILVMTDDQGYANLGSLGHPILRTANIDRLHEQAVRPANYHVDPTCSPTRGALMTGRYSDRVGTWHTIMGRNFLRAREVTMADVFAASGYATGIFGKWHLGDNYPFRPGDRGFEETVVHGGGGIGQTPDFWGNDYFDDVYLKNGTPTAYRGFCTDVFFDEAMKFIQRSAAAERPFFVYLPCNAPHSPFYAPEANKERVRREAERASLTIKRETEGYYGMIENIDDNFGRLQRFLAESGLAENTILIFTSDNGPVIRESIELYNAGLREGKNSRYDGGHRVPFFLAWPRGGLAPGADVAPVLSHVDVLPTLIDLCGLHDPGVSFDGRSFAALLRDPASPWPDRKIVVETQRIENPRKYRRFAVMSDRWRLTGDQDPDRAQLYDILADRGQQHDLRSEQAAVATAHLLAYETFWADVARDHALVSRMIIGATEANPVPLTAHDWLGNALWDQDHIRHPLESDSDAVGFWSLEVARQGWYQISLRRWPAEADRPIRDAYVGTGFDIRQAKLEIQGQSLVMPVESEAREVTFRVYLRQGAVDLRTSFLGPDVGISAFYAYVLREDGRELLNWQTRPGLGLPLALWPIQPGADPAIHLSTK